MVLEVSGLFFSSYFFLFKTRDLEKTLTLRNFTSSDSFSYLKNKNLFFPWCIVCSCVSYLHFLCVITCSFSLKLCAFFSTFYTSLFTSNINRGFCVFAFSLFLRLERLKVVLLSYFVLNFYGLEHRFIIITLTSNYLGLISFYLGEMHHSALYM